MKRYRQLWTCVRVCVLWRGAGTGVGIPYESTGSSSIKSVSRCGHDGSEAWSVSSALGQKSAADIRACSR